MLSMHFTHFNDFVFVEIFAQHSGPKFMSCSKSKPSTSCYKKGDDQRHTKPNKSLHGQLRNCASSNNSRSVSCKSAVLSLIHKRVESVLSLEVWLNTNFVSDRYVSVFVQTQFRTV